MCEEKLIKLGLFSLRREQNFKKPYLGLEEGILLLSTGLQWKRESQTLGGAQWWNEREVTQVTAQEIPVMYKEKCFHHEGSQMLEQDTGR